AHHHCVREYRRRTGLDWCDVCGNRFDLPIEEPDRLAKATKPWWRLLIEVIRRRRSIRNELYWRLSSVSDLALVAVMLISLRQHAELHRGVGRQFLLLYFSAGLVIKICFHLVKWTKLVGRLVQSAKWMNVIESPPGD